MTLPDPPRLGVCAIDRSVARRPGPDTIADMDRLVPIGDAAQALGVSLDTLRRWERDGRLQAERGRGNRRMIRSSDIERLGGRVPTRVGDTFSARNRFEG